MTSEATPAPHGHAGGHVAAIVVNWNGADHLADCLRSLRAQTQPVDIVVVDNASTDESSQVLARTEFAEVTVIQNRTNRGYAGGANDGLAATDHPVVLLANPDVRFDPHFVAAAVAALDRDERIGSVQPRLLRMVEGATPPVPAAVIDSAGHGIDRARLFLNRGQGHPARDWAQPAEVFGVTGAAALHRRAMLDDIAVERPNRRMVFDESLFAYFEDVDVDWRAHLRGWKARYEPAAIAWHERGGLGPRRTDHVEELNFANRLLVLAKHDVRPSLFAAVQMLLVTVAKAATLRPRVLWSALRRVRMGWASARADRALIRAVALIPPAQVLADWAEPFEPHRLRGEASAARRRGRLG